MTREKNLMRFVENIGWGSAERRTLAGDASNRRYDRLTADTGQTAVLMDAPPEKGEDVAPFIAIAQFLKTQGLSAPEILAEDREKGFLLIEDLGDRLFAKEVIEHPAMEDTLYHAAVDVLVKLHDANAPELEVYNAQTAVPLAAMAFDWYLRGVTGDNDDVSRAAFITAFTDALGPLDASLDVVIQRDYHAENLLWLPERDGVARVGLLDFQDAMLGHRAYDLVSVLQDARRDVPPDLQDRMLASFIDKTGCSDRAFRQAYALWGAQRNLRIVGIFARLCLRDGKAHYVDLIPRVWQHVITNLSHPALKGVAEIVFKALPTPTETVLQNLKDKCGTWTGH